MAQAPEETCVIVSETVSEALETPVEDLPPLSDAVDPDALDALVSSTDGGESSAVVVTFTYSGLCVHVHSGQIVYARPVGNRDPDRLPS